MTNSPYSRRSEQLRVNLMASLVKRTAFTEQQQQLLEQFAALKDEDISVEGFPGAAAGDVRGPNNLRRTNWFNGRYLTAEALSRQDVYFDGRSRLNAQALMPGIAWGLGVEGIGLNRTPLVTQVRNNDFPINKNLSLQRGLAFDHGGRPILVSKPFSFTLEQLIGVYRKAPQRVVAGRTEFAPCLCLAPDPGGPSGGAALRSGPYLLVIEASETAEGQAKVMGDMCGGRQPVTCEAESWRSGFGLSLVRFPVDLPQREDLPTAWDLRGTLSAYYFDVFEHALWRRWDPPFLNDEGFCEDTGSGRHDGGAIALAMLYLGEDDTCLFLDPWIPRRTICATPGEDWHRTRFGAPPRAAAWARLHQFQCMLRQSLAVEPQQGEGTNLYSRGFRHIPPIGFLPVVPGSAKAEVQPVEVPQKEPKCSTISEVALEGDMAMKNPFNFGLNPRLGEITVESNGETNTAKFRIENNRQMLVIGYNDVVKIQLDSDWDEVTIDLFLQGSGDKVIATAFGRNNNSSLATMTLNKPNEGKITLQSKNGQSIKKVTLTREGDGEIHLTKICCTQKPPLPSPPSAVTGPRSALIKQALEQAEGYFAGTNVVVYGVAALHDDDILEDLHNVIDKDPLQLEKAAAPEEPSPEIMNSQMRNVTSRRQNGPIMFLRSFGSLLRSKGLDLDALVNRRTEVVKLIVPLQGLSRNHPLLGVIAEDAAPQAAIWGLPGSPAQSAASLVGVRQQGEVDQAPRLFVVYVKQRMVLLDLLFQVLELLESLVRLVLEATVGTPAFNGNTNDIRAASIRPLFAVSTKQFIAALNTINDNDKVLIRSIATQPWVQDLLLQALTAGFPSLQKGDWARRFLQQVGRLRVTHGNPESYSPLFLRLALAPAIDAWAADSSAADRLGFETLQLLAAVQPPQLTLDLVKRLASLSRPVAGNRVIDTLDESSLEPPVFDNERSRLLYAAVRPALEERKLGGDVLRNQAPGTLNPSLTVGAVLESSREDAIRILGEDEDVLNRVIEAYLTAREQAIKSAEILGEEDSQVQELVARAVAEVRSGDDPSKAIPRLSEKIQPKPEGGLLNKIRAAQELVRLGGNRIEVLEPLLRNPRP
jgi:hypothetical protein